MVRAVISNPISSSVRSSTCRPSGTNGIDGFDIGIALPSGHHANQRPNHLAAPKVRMTQCSTLFDSQTLTVRGLNLDLAHLQHHLLRTRLLTSLHVQLLRSWLILSISPVQNQPVRLLPIAGFWLVIWSLLDPRHLVAEDVHSYEIAGLTLGTSMILAGMSARNSRLGSRPRY